MAEISQSILTRLAVEDFLYKEAALLDAWELDDWLSLYSDDCRYEVAPTALDNAAELDVNSALFLVADDRFRLEQRVIRMKKPTAHVEYPHSKTRHIFSNIRVLEDLGEELRVALNFATFRTKMGLTNTYMGSSHYTLRRSGDTFKIVKKRVVLDLDNLVPHGTVALFL